MLFKYLNTEETDPTVIVKVSVTKKKTPTVKRKVTKKNTDIVKAKNPKKNR